MVLGRSMEKMIAELKQLISFKETTNPGDIVLICIKKPQFLSYALVTAVTRDTTRRDEWYQVEMQLLTVPPQPVTWILRPPQLAGLEIFTMGGEEHFVKAVVFKDNDEESLDEEMKSEKKTTKKVSNIRRIK